MGAELSLDLALTRGSFTLEARFTAPPGVTVLFGPSGAGKSTVLDAVAGLVHPDRGRVVLGERVLFDHARRIALPPRARGVGYVFQSRALFPHRTVLENVCYGLAALPRPARHARALALLERLGVERLASRAPATLSGGEQQRVAIARALCPEPSLLLLDEPLAALDRPRRADLIALLRSLVRERALSALVVTHEPEEAEALGDRVVVLEQGAVAATGLPLELLEGSAPWAVAALAPGDNRLDAVVLARRALDGALAVRAGSVEFLARPADVAPGTRVVLAIRAAEILLALDPPGRISAANVLPGTVVGLTPAGPVVRVEVDCGVPLRAEITPAALQRLGLRAGTPLWLVCKTRACHVLRS